jgi:hypothetical protein
VCIDLRERLAPYTDDTLALEDAPEEGELTPTLIAPLPRAARERPLRATPYQPRHLAP